MSSLKIAKSRYRKLLDDITDLYENARRGLAEFYWGTGKRIVEVEQQGRVRAPYGKGLLYALSLDLSKRHGRGFSVINLRRMRSFYLAHRKRPTSVELGWSQRAELLPIEDEAKRRILERKALREGLTSREIRELVRKENVFRRLAQNREAPVEVLPPLNRTRDLELYTFKKAELPAEAAAFQKEGEEFIDCGFYVRRAVSKSELKDVRLTTKPAYAYPALVDRIVDGDTFFAVIHAGFGTIVHWKLRLRGIDCPERGTPEGEKAKRYVERLLPRGSRLVIKSTKTDVHGRFVADVFFKNGESRFEEIAQSGVWLNQHLLDERLAVRMNA